MDSQATKQTRPPGSSTSPADPVLAYARAVTEKRQVAGPHVRAACARHLRDLELGPKRGIVWSLPHAMRAINFFSEVLCLSTGQFEGRPFLLIGYEAFIVGSIFGWLRAPTAMTEDGTPIAGPRRFRTAYVEIAKGNGKALALDTPIPTPSGWSSMGAIEVGDEVFDETGRVCRVVAATDVMEGRPCFCVGFNDGERIVADASHQWAVSSLLSGGRKGPKPSSAPRRGGPAIRTTEQIASTLRRKDGAANHRIQVAGPLETPYAALPIPPYTLGAWLGDGDSDCPRLTMATSDNEIAEAIRAEGVTVEHGKPHNPGCERLRLGRGWLHVALREAGLLGAKHIPVSYLRASIAQRVALLRGLMDTDGYIDGTDNGRCEFTTTTRALADGMLELLTSLGFKPSMSEGRATLYGRDCGPKYRITFHADAARPVFGLTRKLARQREAPACRPMSRGRMIVECERVDSVPVRCIQVDSPSHLFLAGRSMIPTHNSPIAAGIGLYCLTSDREARAEVYAGAPLALDTLVPTPAGWTTQGALRVGDQVYAPDGSACAVTYLSPILKDRDCFEVEFEDGTVIVSDAAHRWSTEDTRGQKPGMYRAAIHTTAQIAATLRAPTGRLRHRIPVASTLDGAECALPIDPYTLGVWLGDGRSNRGSICYHRKDTEPLRLIEAAGYVISAMKPQNNTCYATIRGLRTALRVAGLLDDKHVPPGYLRASPRQRLALLRGLMDTDGTCTKNGECRFTNRERRLASAVHELATGLGLRAHLRAVDVKGAPHWIVSFRAPQSLPVFAISRKRVRQVATLGQNVRARYIRDVRPCASVPVRCIEVDSPEHLYLVSRSHIATHNTKKDQAMILFRDAVAMVDQSPQLQQRIVKTPSGPACYNLGYLATASWFRCIASEDKQSGPRPHCFLIDELHEHPDGTMVNMAAAGQKFRLQPLTFEITNSGFDKTSICYQHHEYSLRVINADAENSKDHNDEWFAYVCGLDENDDPLESEDCWHKANPGLDVIIQRDYLRKQVTEAKGMPAVASTVRRLNFCEWVDAANPWIERDLWLACETEFDALTALEDCSRVVGAIDLSGSRDLTALALTGLDEHDRVIAYVDFWTPEATLRERAARDRVPYSDWVRDKMIIATPGRAVDYAWVAQRLVDLQTRLPQFTELGFDPYRMKYLETELDQLGAEFTLIEHPQGYYKPKGKLDENGLRLPELWMPHSIEVLEADVSGKKLRVQKNPVLTWNSASAVLEPDPKNNKIFTKRKSTGRIDGIVALAMSDGLLRGAGGERDPIEEMLRSSAL